MYIKRYLEASVLKLSQSFKVLYVGGARQVGKSTLLEKLSEQLGMERVSLDDVALRKQAQTDPDLFLQQFKAPLFIDEVQYAPELLSYIKLRVDKGEEKGQYWLSGSQHFSLLKGMQESLAGRVGILSLYGLSLAEEYGYQRDHNPFVPGRQLAPVEPLTLSSLRQRVFRGDFPALAVETPVPRDNFYESYIQTYLDRDVSGIFGVEKIRDFHTLLELVAGRTAQILNISNLARDAGVSVNSVKNWLSVLEASGIVFFLRPFFTSLNKRLSKTPKLYLTDTGLAAYLTKWSSAETMQSGAMAGAFFETAAVMEIVKSYAFRGQRAPIYYYRDQQGREIDVIIESDGKVFPIEIKVASGITENDTAALRYFRQRESRFGRAAVICSSLKSMAWDNDIDIVPLSLLS